MGNKFSYSFFGYDPQAVEEKTGSLHREFQNRTQKLISDLSGINEGIRMLQQEIRKIDAELVEYKRINDEIMQILFAAHMEASEEVFKSVKKAEQTGSETRETVLRREKEYTELNNTLKRLTQEMQSVVRGYNRALEAYGDA